MTDRQPKGHVEFRQPAAKLVADAPGDEQMRENLDEMRMNDGFPGSCGIAQGSKQE